MLKMQKEKLTVLDEPVTPPNPARVDGADPLPPLTLISLLPGERGTIDRLQWADPEMRRRLLEMGLVTGTQIEVIRYAPLGDPLQPV